MLLMQTLWEELSEYMVKRYFDPELPYFYNLSNRLDGKSIVWIIAAVILGVLAAGTVYVYQRRVLGAIPRAVVAASATDEATAETLPALGIRLNFMRRLALRSRSSAMRRYIRFVGEAELTYEDFKRGAGKKQAVDLENTPCYIPSEKLEECSRRFAVEKSGSWGTVVWLWLGGIVLFFVLCRFLPTVMGIVDRLAGAFG